MVERINVAEKFAKFDEYWQPKIVGEVNDTLVKLVKFKGEFVWHHHEREDELFLVIRGRMTLQLRSGDLVLEPGEFVIVPHGVEHCPKADGECWVVLLEPRTTL